MRMNKRKHGDLREDGFVFWGYQKKNLLSGVKYVEKWLSPGAFERHNTRILNYYKNNKEKKLESCKKYHYLNRDKINNKKREWYKNNKEKVK